MTREAQYEVRILVRGKWELIAAFRHFEPAAGMAQLRSERVRLVRVFYENGKAVERELLVEVGATRKRD
jgi:hypothetical protein